MSNLATRIASLSPQKRELLELLVKKPVLKDPPVDLLTEDRYFSLAPGVFPSKQEIAHLYNLITNQLNASEFGEYSIFLNWGYIPNENPHYSQINLPEVCLNKNSKRLVLEMIGDYEWQPTANVLDVGCGRGGTISVLREFFQINQVIGIDLSPNAIAFCHQVHSWPNTFFLVGDSESLALKEHCVEVVTNLESSHCYSDIFAFYQEVYRVLKPGGYFLYADVFPSLRLETCKNLLTKAGFELLREQDITSNILLSCDHTADNHAKVFNQENNPNILDNFLARPHSHIYQQMQTGLQTYQLFKLYKAN